MLHDILDDDHIQWHPPLIGHYTNFWPLLIWTLLPNLTFYLIVQGFPRTYATGAACQQRTLTPPDTWSCPTLGLACVLMSRPIPPELVLSPDFWISNTPRYLSFVSYSRFTYPWRFTRVPSVITITELLTLCHVDLFTEICATCAFLKLTLNVRLTHFKSINRVRHLYYTVINARTLYLRQEAHVKPAFCNSYVYKNVR